MFINDLADSLFKFAKKNAPTILTMTASIGVISTAVVTSKMTKKIEDKKEEIYSEETDIPKKATRILKEVAPLYLPIIGVVTGTIACTVMSDVLNIKQQKRLAEGTLLMSALFSTYRSKVREEIGPEKEQKLYSESIASLPTSTDEVVTFRDPLLQYEFETTWFNFIQAQYDLNCFLIENGEARMSDFYRSLPEIKLKDIPERAKVFGWDKDMLLDSPSYWIHYGVRSVISERKKFYEISWHLGPVNLEYDDDDLGPWESANEQIIFD